MDGIYTIHVSYGIRRESYDGLLAKLQASKFTLLNFNIPYSATGENFDKWLAIHK